MDAARAELVESLVRRLLAEAPERRAWEVSFPRGDVAARRQLLRALMNVRPPAPLAPDFLRDQDALLFAERDERGTVDAESLPPFDPANPSIALWRGNITRLKADAIVNAANDALLGCFAPLHGCIDNAIHSAAGLQLRNACAEIAAARYRDFLARTENARTLFLDLGSGWNTTGIFKVPFWKMTLRRAAARYACLNIDANQLPKELGDLALHVRSDIGATLAALRG